MAKYLFRLLRFNPARDKKPYFQDFYYESSEKDSVLDALRSIRDNLDPTLAFRYSCREAICGACGMVINGQITLACRTILESLKSRVVVIEPLPNLEIQKDLMVDMTPFWEALREIEPFLHPQAGIPKKGYRIEERQMERIYQFINCILCGCCYSACPVVARGQGYLGPAALAKLYRFVEDPRDKRPFSQWSRVDKPSGVWACDTVFRCHEVCPKNVRPADGIEGLRRKLVIERIKRLFRKEP
jgi:succinate dehydrogenase/fumarate reductase iron-sulfur protein